MSQVNTLVQNALTQLDEAIRLSEAELTRLRSIRRGAAFLGGQITSPPSNAAPAGVRSKGQRVVRSFTSNVNYTVELFTNSLYDTCTCPDFTHRGAGRIGYACKHIRESREAEDRTARARHWR